MSDGGIRLRLLGVLGAVLLVVLVLGVVPLLRPGAGPAPAADRESRGVEVDVVPLRRGTVRATVHALGTVQPSPAVTGEAAASAAVGSPVEGVVGAVRCAEGQAVLRGAILFVLDTRAADAAVARAETALRFARRTLERRRVLIQIDATSAQLLQEAERAVAAAEAELSTARTARDLLEIRAPLSGTVVRVGARAGESVRRDTVLAEILDTHRLVAAMQMPLSAARAVRVGQWAVVHPDRKRAEAGGADLETRVIYVGARADPRTGTLPVRVAIPAGSGMVSGSLVDVEVVTEMRRGRLLVPVEGVVTLDGETTIAVVENHVARRVPVTLGLVDGRWAEIQGAGLREGMSVVAAGSYGLPDGTRVRARPRPAAR